MRPISLLFRVGEEPDWQRPSPDRASLRLDVWMWLLVLAFTLLLNAIYQSIGLYGQESQQVLYAYLATVCMTLPLAVRRRWPLTMLILATGLFFGLSFFSLMGTITFSYQVCYFIILYTAVAWGKNRQMVWILYTLVCLLALGWLLTTWVISDSSLNLLGLKEDYGQGPLDRNTATYLFVLLTNTFYYGCAALMGASDWRRAYQRSLLEAQARQIEDQAQQLAQDAVAKERLRIARELHDSVGHHVSSMGIQAAAARRALAKKPDMAILALGRVEELARQSLAEMKNLVRLLRAATGPERESSIAEPQITDIPDLMQQMTLAGLRGQLHLLPSDRELLISLPRGTQLSIYRIVQEALTNIRRHAQADNFELALRTGGRQVKSWVEIEVSDDGKPASFTPGRGGGFGLQGIRERAMTLGGSSSIGPRPGDRGWQVRVIFPVDLRGKKEESYDH